MTATAATRWCIGLFLMGLLAMGAVNGAPAADKRDTHNILAPYRGRNQVLLVFAPSRQNARYQEQSDMLADKTAGLNERDLILIYALADGKGRRVGTRLFGGGDEKALRQRYGVGPQQFRVVLVGKDGHEAYSSREPLSSTRLFGLIDAMPMRREEMRRQQRH